MKTLTPAAAAATPLPVKGREVRTKSNMPALEREGSLKGGAAVYFI
jgi:hypothetical protein